MQQLRHQQEDTLIILGSKRLSFDIFETIMIEVELVLNSRPLTKVADQPDNEEQLTPKYFLIQRPYSSLPSQKLWRLTAS